MEKDRMNGAFDSSNEAEVIFFLTELLGAVLFYLINLGQVPFDELYIKKYRTKHVICGYAINLCTIASFYLWLYYFMS